MLPLEPLILLIDGNNLAHFLYTNLVPGQKMTQADSRRLIEHLDSYARSYARELQVELCLDRSPGILPPGAPPLGTPPLGAPPPPADRMRVYSAEYPQTADDLLLGRFWFHQESRQACLVITNDEAILEEVAGAKGTAMRVYDFVRRPGLVTPVFRAPDELPAVAPPPPPPNGASHHLSLSTSLYFRITAEESPADNAPVRLPSTRPNGYARRLPGSLPGIENPSTRPAPPPMNTPPRSQTPHPDALPEAATLLPDGPVERQSGQPEDASPEEGPYYFLSLDTWPVEEGVRFLLNAFCPTHRAAHQDLIDLFDPADLRPADLRALADLLLRTCGDEPDFARRGALMARVRLALLQARGEPLTLEQLAERTNLKLNGLRGRVKEKAGKWIEIL